MLDPRFKACILASRCGSISDAANALYLSKQAVKKQIDSLEHELGITIFSRSSKGLELTPAGKMYVEGIEKLVEQHGQLISRCHSRADHETERSLTILQPNHPKLYFKEALLEYNEKYPNVRIKITDVRKMSILYNNTARIRSVLEGKVDVAFAPNDTKFDKSQLNFIKLGYNNFYCVMKRGHPLCQKEKITREDLAGYPVQINTVIDRKVYEYIINQDIGNLPERIVYAENEGFSVSGVAAFCLNNGIYFTKGDYLDTLDPMTARPFDPPFSLECGLFCRYDAPEHVKAFVDMVCKHGWYPAMPNDYAGNAEKQQ